MRGAKRHTGTGSGTAVTLASLEALFAINRVSVIQADLIRISGKGGTSGIGIHTYFDGEFVVDIGRGFDTAAIMSSDEILQPKCLSHLVARYPMPRWTIGLLFPACPPLTLEQEKRVFASLTSESISPA